MVAKGLAITEAVTCPDNKSQSSGPGTFLAALTGRCFLIADTIVTVLLFIALVYSASAAQYHRSGLPVHTWPRGPVYRCLAKKSRTVV